MFKKIGVLQLSLLAISAIVSLRNLPIFAEIGLSIVVFLFIAAFMFFIPVTMVVVELSSTWPDVGGCYLWVKKAYGKYVAFLVLWAAWMESIIWFPTILIFMVSMLSYVLSPFFDNLISNKFFLLSGIVLIFWFLTIINFYGIKVSAVFSSIGVVIGTIIPIFFIIILGLSWFFSGKNINIDVNFISLFPTFNFDNIVFFSSILLGLSGIELISFHIKDVVNPHKNFKKSLFISVFFILIVYIFGALSIAIVVPKNEICLSTGIVQAFNVFFLKTNLAFVVPFLSLLLLIGSLSGMNTWLIGPSKGLLVAADDGLLPPFFKIVNKAGVPTNLLILQAFIGSILSVSFFLFMDSINGLIWIFVCLSFQFAAFLYVMIFFSAIKLRKLYPNIERPYKVKNIYLISFLGIFSCLFTFFISYIQPSSIIFYKRQFYVFILFFTFFVLLLPPFFFIFFNKIKK